MNKLMISICGTRLHSFDKNYLTMQNPCKRLTFFAKSCKLNFYISLRAVIMHQPQKPWKKNPNPTNPSFLRQITLFANFVFPGLHSPDRQILLNPHTHLNKYEGDMGSQTSFGAHQSGDNSFIFIKSGDAKHAQSLWQSEVTPTMSSCRLSTKQMSIDMVTPVTRGFQR